MSALAILIDTDVLIDFLIDRKPFTKNSKEIIQKSRDGAVSAYMAAHSITNIFYILRKTYTVLERKKRLLDLCKFINVVDIKNELIINALTNKNDDIEDNLQIECACAINADYIITRNIEHYKNSKIPVMLPQDFLGLLNSKTN
ncbi:MAG: PIN domain-containing protein [Treponema sp.]|nr:PIN domain-containing protein [Treponema sp.]